MKREKIWFPEANRAELTVDEIEERPGPGQVLIRTAYSTVSPGTEKANITGNPNVGPASGPSVKFPRCLGYSSAGVVAAVGEGVTRVKPGDRAIGYWGVHAAYNMYPESRVVKIPYENLGLREAAALFISTFPMAAIRKTRLEMGESCMVMGLGLLGQFAVRLARCAGGAPVVAADPVAERRENAIKGGADCAFDPFEKDFAQRVKEVTGGGVNAAIEVTGQGAGLDETLDCMARFGRVALLGCTRDPNFTIDYYRKIHAPGITLIGAHTNARPMEESHPGWFTHDDDLAAAMRLCAMGRLDVKSMLGPLHEPADCPQVYDRLIHDRNFPMMLQFDWTKEA